MFFSKIYKSWEGIQEEKYNKIIKGFGTRDLTWTFLGRVLDVGSGTGYFEKFLKKNGFDIKEWVCIDPDADMLKEGGFSRILGSGNHLPFREKTFDGLVCLDSIHLIKENFFWVLKSGGHMLVSLFCNPGNLEEKKAYLKNRMKGFMIIKEFVFRGRESEIFILAKKR